jgi:glutamate N-acetyltransferase/amino-acid N-acetyltransferase
MIGPDMAPMTSQSTLNGAPANLHATLLAFLTTDARVEKALLQSVLESAVAKSFNSVTVDGDTSTNDSAILLAGGGGQNIDQSTLASFQELVDFVCIELAKKVARDGEGATKLVTIEVEGANSEVEAKKVALTIANSPLVKTAIFGRDPNWGRIAMAAGRSGVAFDANNLAIWLGAVEVFRDGEPIAFDQVQAAAAMSEENLTIKVLLGAGDARWTAWTCDFSYDYVKINAEYHT